MSADKPEIVWIAFHRDAITSLGTRSEEGLKLKFDLVDTGSYGEHYIAELTITVEDDGMRLVPHPASKLVKAAATDIPPERWR